MVHFWHDSEYTCNTTTENTGYRHVTTDVIVSKNSKGQQKCLKLMRNARIKKKSILGKKKPETVQITKEKFFLTVWKNNTTSKKKKVRKFFFT